MANEYITVAELKAALSLAGESFADPDIARSITAASRAVEDATDRRFWQDADVNQVRYYTPKDAYRLSIDDLVTLTALATDLAGAGTFTQSWTANTDFVIKPLNAAADGYPYTTVCAQAARSTLYFPVGYLRSVRVTGRFGWPAVPDPVKQATMMIASRLLKRVREAPFGVAGFGMDGVAVRVARQDPDVVELLAPYERMTY